MASGWAAPSPLLLPLRPPALVAEEVAWLAARFPGRVGLGVASGALPADFEVMGLDDARARATLRDRARGGRRAISTDRVPVGSPATRRSIGARTHPIPVVSAAMGFTAVRRAAALGVGVLFDSMSTPERCRELDGRVPRGRWNRVVRAHPARVGR